MATSAEQYRQHTLPPSPHQAQQQYFPQQQQQQQQPQPPQQTYQPPPRASQQRQSQNPPAKSRTLSFHSQKSHKSSGSRDLHETSAEKEKKRLHTKADPTLAISEAEPSTIAAMKSESTFAPLRSMQHKDSFGNAIADPDKSNPTRNRWERPLDTIRSFEAAIDGGYARKSIYGTESVANYNRRNSSFTGNQPRFPHDSYYNGRPQSFRPEQTQFDLGARSSYFDPQQHGGNYGNPPVRQRMPRIQTDPQYQSYGRNPNIYPMPNKDRSYETVTSAAGSGNSDQAGYQTDPTSSDNSSIDRTVPAKRRDPVNDCGARPSQGQPQYQRGYLAPVPNGQGRQPQQQAPNSAPPTAVPQATPPAGKQKGTLLRRTSTQQTKTEAPEKRKSWFARRFSKNS
ncbi:hypothetical protein BGZ61DRAFT_80279 [Ilyonectria robusta]|uniref:uncharacterized protein n=1 Tax=Ilyonectria robusta TaxID=1079257 RepID=UPI001E8DC4C9|nr:uncharacterized protein BGZ61DRAFT_80279 [Ilyonectria robusta]KAH8735487.1 hypothetical protein BGZ61DRAFT_80279 [Ilyonectria robusta]